MRLIEAWNANPERAYALFGAFPANEHGFVNDAYGMDRDEFARYLRRTEDMHAGRDLPPGYAPATKYILVNDEGEYVGIVNLRHRLNDALREGAGHIGYGIAPAYRGHGYATEGLRLALAIARDVHGIDEAYLSVDKDNPASLAVQRHCGARIDHENDTEYFTRIDTTALD
ncbi:GNAT family N-acetyltransferase [Bifidobacterium phasiani]|uniref:GNAT family N-acetyltransferase n=1 Tax=Bifidobacterium phasiani TaxID=2834431 RepID=A0ABS6W8D9_9BIFI|nr:GNAT family N-acetyltransferase [Bifidobacterium phasiani]MBW3082460.1 GNAT family N-acetyltransferase [Bifidobacterium phasiani]